MGRSSSISPELGARLLEAYKATGNKAEAARMVGIGESAARRYLDATPQAAAPVIATQQSVINEAGASLFRVTDALEENYQRVQALITKLEAGITEVRDGPNGTTYQTHTSPLILVSALKEARGYIDSASRVLELMVSVHEVRRFQQAMLDALNDCDAATRQHILDRLRRNLPYGVVPGGGR